MALRPGDPRFLVWSGRTRELRYALSASPEACPDAGTRRSGRNGVAGDRRRWLVASAWDQEDLVRGPTGRGGNEEQAGSLSVFAVPCPGDPGEPSAVDRRTAVRRSKSSETGSTPVAFELQP